jgi:iron complex outermembrane receptor protein
MRGSIGLVDVNVAVFNSWFSDYIHLADTGQLDGDLPIYRQLQGDARYFGIEAQMGFPLVDNGDLSLRGELGGDYIRATLGDGTPVERIPPLSLQGALEAKAGPFDLRGEVHWYDKQTRIASFETPTDGFTEVNLSLAWNPLQGDDNLTIMLQADNLFDVEGRRHASFTKDFVPLPGRNIKLSAKASF